jgi:hypothetical protein
LPKLLAIPAAVAGKAHAKCARSTTTRVRTVGASLLDLPYPARAGTPAMRTMSSQSVVLIGQGGVLLAGRSRGVGHGLLDARDHVGHGLLLRLGESRVVGKPVQGSEGVRV